MQHANLLDIINKGVMPWNDWKKKNSGAKIDLGQANLSWMDLDAINLREVNLSGANLRYTSLDKAELQHADLSKANLEHCILSEANLSWANLSDANLQFSSCDETNFSNSNLSRADLRTASLVGATLIRANFTEANISGVKFDDVNISKWIINGIKCSHILRGDNRIDYNPMEFEKLWTEIEKELEMILNSPFSDFTYYTGRLVEKAINKKHGRTSLLFTGQKALSRETTKLEFVSFITNEEMYVISDYLKDIQRKLDPIFEEIQNKKCSQGIIGIKDEIDIPLMKGLVVRPKEINKKLNEQYMNLAPWLQKIILAIQATIQ